MYHCSQRKALSNLWFQPSMLKSHSRPDGWMEVASTNTASFENIRFVPYFLKTISYHIRSFLLVLIVRVNVTVNPDSRLYFRLFVYSSFSLLFLSSLLARINDSLPGNNVWITRQFLLLTLNVAFAISV